MLRCMGCMEEFNDGRKDCPRCGHPVDALPPEGQALPEGSILAGRYIVGRVLGSGGFGITYIGFDAQLERKVAIKEYLSSALATRDANGQSVSVFTGEAESGFEKGLSSFANEARRLATLSDQPGIVDVYETISANNTAYIIMEYLQGQTLKELLEKQDRLSYPDALTLMVPVLDALQTVHASGIIHRDIAPDNIIVGADGKARLIDFGAARIVEAGESKSLTVVVKQGYAPEEQYRSRGEQGTWTDVYAVSATFYRMVTGVVPDEPPNRMEHDTLAAPSALDVEAPWGFDAVITDALALRADERIQTIEELTAALCDPASYQPRSTKQKRTTALTKRAQTTLIAAAAVVLVAAIGIGVFFALNPFGNGGEQPVVGASGASGAIDEQTNPADTNTQSAAQSATAKEEPAAPSTKVGDHLKFGTFQGQPIEWRVLAVEDGKALVISEHVLEVRQYNDRDVAVTWETCTLRQYLNGEFLRTNFSADEQSQIVTVTNQNLDNPEHSTPGGNPTDDRLFLLSVDEAENYFIDNIRRVADDLQGVVCRYWLRSCTAAADDSGFAYDLERDLAYVHEGGLIHINTGRDSMNVRYASNSYGVRPALWLAL